MDLRSPELKVAVVHDWLTGMRGGEKVLEAILDLFPQAEIFTLFHFPGAVSATIESRRIHTSLLQPLARRIADYRRLLPLFPSAISRWKFESFDLVVSSSHCVAKGVRTGTVPHVSYCHTPMRYIWDRFDDYFPRERPFLRIAGVAAAGFLRKWDVRTAASVHQFVANSTFVRDRINTHYRRDAIVIHPFVDERFLEAPLQHERDNYHLVISALVPYKRVEVAIGAAQLAGRRLVVIGDGPSRRDLEASGGETVEFRGWEQPDKLLAALQRAQSLVIPGVEDFGITALEALACGTPVIALREGGVSDSVDDDELGILVEGGTEAFAEAMIQAESRTWNRERLRDRAQHFTRERFQQKFMDVVRNNVAPNLVDDA